MNRLALPVLAAICVAFIAWLIWWTGWVDGNALIGIFVIAVMVWLLAIIPLLMMGGGDDE